MLDKSALKIIFLSGFFGLILVAVYLLGSAILSREPGGPKPEKLSKNVLQLSVSENGSYAYVEGNNLHFKAKNIEEKIIEGFVFSDLEISQNGSYLSYKNGSSCEIKSLPDFTLIKNEKCLREIVWISDSSYLFFEGSDIGNSDFLDEDVGDLILSDVSGQVQKQTINSVSPNSSIVINHGNPTHIAVNSDVEEMSSLCEIDTSSKDLLKNCLDVDGNITAIKQNSGSLYVTVFRGLSEQNYIIKDSKTQTLGSSINLQKTAETDSGLFVFDDSNPTETSVKKIAGTIDPKIENIKIALNRFHSINETHKIDSSTYLIWAENGLWRLSI